MAFELSVGDILRQRIFTSCKPPDRNLSLALNIIHWRISAQVGNKLTSTFVVTSLSGTIAPLYKAALPPIGKFEGTTIQRVSPLPISTQAGTNQDAGVGTHVGEPLPLETCGAITKTTALAGRKFRGRLYVSFPTETDNAADAVPNAAYLALIGPIRDFVVQQRTITNGVDSFTLDPVLFHTVGVPNFTVIVSGTANPYWTSQRRRQNTFHTDTLPIFVL